jgi:hypothetical protein
MKQKLSTAALWASVIVLMCAGMLLTYHDLHITGD